MSDLLTPRQVAKLLQIREQTLATWRMDGRELAIIRVGRCIRYRAEDVQDYLRHQTVGAAGQDG